MTGFPTQAKWGALAAATLILAAAGSAQANWPQWRGPHGTGMADAQGLPTTWSETENVKWKTPLPSWSGSTPIVWEDAIFLTTASKGTAETAAQSPEGGPQARMAQRAERGERPGGPGREGFRGRGGAAGEGQAGAPGQRARGGGEARGGPGGRGGGERLDPGGDGILLWRVDRATGEIVWEREFDRGNALNRKANRASCSPVTDGEHVWALSGNGVLACFDFDGNEAWKVNLAEEHGPFIMAFGLNSSPLLWENLLILPIMHGSESFLLAIDKTTGQEAWKTPRPTSAIGESKDAYTTAQVVMKNDNAQIVVNGADVVTAHDPLTGREIWRASGLNPQNQSHFRIVPSPVVAGDLVISPTRVQPMVAVRAGGEGDVTKTHTVWTRGNWGPDVPTPATDGERLWMVRDRGGIFACLDVATGEVFYDDQRAEDALGTYSASPVLADGKVYVVNEDAETIVLAAEREFQVLAINYLDPSYTLGTPAIVDNQIFLKTGSHLYCIQKMEDGTGGASGQAAATE